MSSSTTKPSVAIRYCVGCRWMLRASWYAQEILSTFEEEIGEVRLIPDQEGGHFSVSIADEMIFSRAEDGFLQAKMLKRMIRDKIAPELTLGHIDHS